MSGRVAGKVALVTGAARGQGRSHAVRLAGEGADLIAVDWCRGFPGMAYPASTPNDLAETARLVEESGRRVVTAAVDIRDREALRTAVDSAVGRLGRLDIVVANAGIAYIAAWDAHTPAMWDIVLGVNLTGAWNTAQLTAPHLIAAGGGSIVLVSSGAALKANPFMTAYVASKYGVNGLMHALAAELAIHHIRVNSVHPTVVDTPMCEGTNGQAIEALLAGQPRLRGIFTNLLPVGAIQPSDVSHAVVYLASDEARYVTSQELGVDAGIGQS
jgi:SDR family mycofactocin-dependent oxidoreductase